MTSKSYPAPFTLTMKGKNQMNGEILEIYASLNYADQQLVNATIMSLHEKEKQIREFVEAIQMTMNKK